jgi:hypothetical protein
LADNRDIALLGGRTLLGRELRHVPAYSQPDIRIIVLGALMYLIWLAPQVVLLILATVYVSSGIVIRIGGIMRRHLRHARPPRPSPEHQVG